MTEQQFRLLLEALDNQRVLLEQILATLHNISSHVRGD